MSRRHRANIQTTPRHAGQHTSEVGTTKKSRRFVLGIAAAAVVVAIILAAVGCSALNSPSTTLDSTAQDTHAESAQAAPGEAITYDGYDYLVQASATDGTYSFVRSKDGSAVDLFQLEGTPVACILYKGSFIIPQNLQGTYNVEVWTLGGGTEAAPLANAQGDPITGDGQITQASLDGSTLKLVLDSGTTQTLQLS